MAAHRHHPSTYDVLLAHGIDRRTFLRFCTLTAAALGLDASGVGRVAHALESKPRIPVMWLHGLECTCCSESFIRSAHPLAQDVVLNLLSLDYDDTLQAAAGFQAEEIRREIIAKHPGGYLLAVEGNAPTRDGGVYCTVGGRTFEDILLESARHAKAVVAWGSCASNGCIQAAHPNPTGAKPVHQLIHDKPVIRVPGCPPIAEVMTGLLAYILTFDRLPDLDRAGRPRMFYGQRLHDKCYRRAFFDAGQFVESWDDEGARRGWCLYKMGCRGPTTYNSCSTIRWNNGISWPVGSGHGCIGCAEDGFWDNGPFYRRLSGIPVPGVQSTPDQVGKTLAVVAAAGAAAHFTSFLAKRGIEKSRAAKADPPVPPPPGPDRA